MNIFKNPVFVTFLPIAFIVLFSLLGTKALFHEGYFTSHDGWHQLARLFHFNQALADGQFPVRWAGQALNDFGYPLFYFSYQLPFYLAQGLQFLGVDQYTAIKACFVIGYVLSGLTMYFFSLDLWGKWGGLLSSVLYLWAPYRFSNIFVRGALGEHFTLIFIPLVFWGIWKIFQSEYVKGMLLLALGIGGVILSHAIVLQLLFIPLIIYCGGLWFAHSDKIKNALAVLVGGVLGMGLAGYYFIPATLGKSSIVGFSEYHLFEHFVTFKQLLYSPWGYGFSFPGENDGMSFQVGIAQWLVLLLTIILLCIFFFLRKKLDNYQILNMKFWILPILFLLQFALSIFLMMEESKPVWDFLRKQVTIDYPWRFLAISTFSAASLAGYGIFMIQENWEILVGKIDLYKKYFSFISQNIVIAFYFVSFVFLALYANRNHIRVNLYELNPAQYVVPSDTSNTYDEYLPKWANLSITKKDKPAKVVTDNENAVVSNLVNKSNLVSFTVSTDKKTQVKVNQFYYPSWQLFINDVLQEKKINGEGIWEFPLEAGENRVKLVFAESFTDQIADGISIFSIFIWLWLWLGLGKKRG